MYQKWFLKPVTGLSSPSSFVIFFLKGIRSQNPTEDSYSPEMMLDSNRYSKWLQALARSSPQHPRASIKNDFSNQLLVWAPRLHLLFSLKSTDCQKLTPGSNQWSDWLHILARSYPQHPRHVPKVISQTSYWFELPVFICYLFLKGYTFTKPNWRLIFTRNDAGLKPLLRMTSNFGQVFPATPQISTQNGHSNRLPVWAPRLHLLF
jgi:hypothetical protein